MNIDSKQKYKKSDHLLIIKGDNEKSLAYHSIFNNPRVLDLSIITFINFFSTPISVDELKHICEGEIAEVMDELIKLHFIVPLDENARGLIKKMHVPFLKKVQHGTSLSRLELAISDACNLGCTHCMHFKNNEIPSRTGKALNMSIDIAKTSIDTFVDVVRKAGNNKVRVHFGNGEPLMNWKMLKYCLEYCSSINDISFSFAINTNLTLVTKEIAEVLKEYNVKISTSLDGLREGNDLIRVDREGKGTFDTIIEKFNLLKSINYPIDGFSITVTSKNFKHINANILDFAIEMGIKDISMDFDLVDTTDIPVEQCVAKIIEMRRYAIQHGLNFYGTWETPYRNLMLSSWLNSPHAFCPAMEGSTIAFGVDGSLKVCGHTNSKIGTISQISDIFSPNSEYINLIKNRLPGNNVTCTGCSIEGACAGQCHVTLESSRRNNKLMMTMCEFMRLTTEQLLKEYISHFEL
ncbi:hypothetical protein C5S31_04085 [ANME-1 cluster archaeon GoMg2]|nr:hypothetical protein [ANME-1 cluster archaeon GoMg2]